MRLPRRVPWTSIAELDQVCSWIFADENDQDAKVLAINRLSAWRTVTSLPHALESTLSLLVVIQQDRLSQQPISHLFLRQSYAATIIRLVNGLVDPLQLGAYARSIASIANQLGLPPWLVELRHAATHEDLPSLEVLREAARQSMAWLLHNYWIPTINPSQSQQPQAPLRALGPILKSYKSLLKITTRDASVKVQYRQAITTVLRDIERWLAEAKIAANVAAGGLGWDVGDQDPKEKWALEKLCDSLMEKGMLVPLSKNKRSFPSDSFLPPDVSVQLWSPLLTHIRSLHPDFSTVLINKIVAYLVSDKETVDADGNFTLSDRPDPSFDMCLARWAMWLADAGNAEDSDESDRDSQRVTMMSVITALGPGINQSGQTKKPLSALLEALSVDDAEMKSTVAMLLSSQTRAPTSEWNPDNISVMEERLKVLFSVTPEQSETHHTTTPTPLSESTSRISAPGWKLLEPNSGWKPCPIGVHCVAAA